MAVSLGGNSGGPMSEINVTPLVDVMLVLLVIFIITAPLLASAIRVDLPQSAAAQPDTPPRFVRLAIDRAGQAYLDDVPITQARLREELVQRAAEDPDTEVQLRADENVPYGRVIAVMGAAQEAGLNRIAFVTEAPRGK